jgi:Thiamine pyrophosphate enzyme, C-terminal TPP binding domain
VIQVIAHYLPEDAILADEAVTSGLPYFDYTATCAPHDYLNLAGGAIGGMMPVGTGAAVACPDRKVVCLEGDGSAMYTLQALWTQARERLDVTTVIYANRSYAILNIELARVGAGSPAELVCKHHPEGQGIADVPRKRLQGHTRIRFLPFGLVLRVSKVASPLIHDLKPVLITNRRSLQIADAHLGP